MCDYSGKHAHWVTIIVLCAKMYLDTLIFAQGLGLMAKFNKALFIYKCYS